MVEEEKQESTVWLPRHSREVQVRLSLGQTRNAIAGAMDIELQAVEQHIQDEGLDGNLTCAEQVEYVTEISLQRALLALLETEPGAAVEGRLLLRVSEFVAQESDVKTRAAIGEMSDDELRDYVASLVPGLETKTVAGDESRGTGADERVSVPNVGETGAETASGRDELA